MTANAAHLLQTSLAAAALCEDRNEDEKIFHIAEHVYLGTRYGAADRHALDTLQIVSVINLTAGETRVPNFFAGQGVEYLHIELTDELLSNPSQAIPRAYREIHRCGEENLNVLVHCSAGLSRSATAVLAWLMRDRSCSLAEAKDLLVQKRGRRPRCNPSFWCYLAALERELTGRPPGTTPTYDFSQWLVEDFVKMGMSFKEKSVLRALIVDADWTNFCTFYTALSGWGFKHLMVAQSIAQRPTVDAKTGARAASVTMDLMEVYHAWPAVQAYCMRIAQSLVCQPGSQTMQVFVRGGMVLKTVTAMQSHGDVADVQEAGCATLAYFRDEAAWQVCLFGGLEAILVARREHASSDVVRHTALAALMIYAAEPVCGARLAALGGVTAALAAMEAHPGDARTQEFGLKALLGFVALPGVALDVERRGGSAVVLAAMRGHQASEVVQAVGSRLLQAQADSARVRRPRPNGESAVKSLPDLGPEALETLDSSALPGA